jgi:hypothetical protein
MTSIQRMTVIVRGARADHSAPATSGRSRATSGIAQMCPDSAQFHAIAAAGATVDRGVVRRAAARAVRGVVRTWG